MNGLCLRSHIPGIRHSMHALVAYQSYHGAVTVWELTFVLARQAHRATAEDSPPPTAISQAG